MHYGHKAAKSETSRSVQRGRTTSLKSTLHGFVLGLPPESRPTLSLSVPASTLHGFVLDCLPVLGTQAPTRTACRSPPHCMASSLECLPVFTTQALTLRYRAAALHTAWLLITLPVLRTQAPTRASVPQPSTLHGF